MVVRVGLCKGSGVGDPMTKQQCMYDIAQLQPTKDLNTGDM